MHYHHRLLYPSGLLLLLLLHLNRYHVQAGVVLTQQIQEPHFFAFRGQHITSYETDANSVEKDRITVIQQEYIEPLPLEDWIQVMTDLKAGKSTMRVSNANADLGNENDSFWNFVPLYMGSIRPGSTLSWSSPCYNSTKFDVSWDSDGKSAVISAVVGSKASILCDETYLITTVHSWTVHKLLWPGTHTIHWRGLTETERQDVEKHGFNVFRMTEGVVKSLLGLYETAMLFIPSLLGSKVPARTAGQNIKFLSMFYDFMNFNLTARTITDAVPRKDLIRSGDMFCILRLDGLDPIILWGTGTHCGHTVIAVWHDEELYILESQVKSNYWPKDLVQRNTYDEWIAMARTADYNVLWLPLSDEHAAKFDAKAAFEKFEKEYEGLMYGYWTMLWGWLDMSNSDNLPPPLDIHLVASLFSIADPILVARIPNVPSMWNGAMSQRLGISPPFTFRTEELYRIAWARNMTFGDLLAIPEQDDWIYPGKEGQYREGPSMVCNAFVCRMWKVGNLFGNIPINCNEFTPFDNTELAIFKTKYEPTAECRAADPDNTAFCQILGRYRMTLPGFNTAKPFTHMREHCPSKAPDYWQRQHNTTVKNTC